MSEYISPFHITFLEPSHQVPDAELQETSSENFKLLTTEDVWLSRLTRQPIDNSFAAIANTFIVTGSADLRQVKSLEERRCIVEARKAFFELLGWTEPTHELHGPFNSLMKRKPVLMQLTTMVDAQRSLVSYGCDTAKVIKNFPDILFYSKDSIHERAQNFIERGLQPKRMLESAGASIGLTRAVVNKRLSAIEGLGLSAVRVAGAYNRALHLPEAILTERVNNIVTALGPVAMQMIELFPSMLGNDGERTARRIVDLYETADRLQWNGSLLTLLSQKAVLLGISDAKKDAHTSLFRSFGDPDMSEAQVGNLIMEPLECHLLAVGNGSVVPGDYRRSAVQKAGRGLDKSQRRSEIAAMLCDDAVRAILGQRTIDAYARYVTADRAAA